MRRSRKALAQVKHDESCNGINGATAEYTAWVNMKQRCENARVPGFQRWGGRGVRVCRAWRDDYRAFLDHVGRRPSRGHSLDRFPDPDGDYRPGNVRWATRKQQCRNTRANRNRRGKNQKRHAKGIDYAAE